LTQGCFALNQLDVFGEKYSRKEVLQFLTMIEERASHPLAQALVDGAKNENIFASTCMSVKDHTFLPGEGVSGKINDLEIYVGNERLFKRLGTFDSLSQDIITKISDWESMGATIGLMSIEGAGIVCAYSVADAIRPESIEVVQSLLKMGIDVHMLTGDKKESAHAVGSLVGLSKYQVLSELLPENKLRFIGSLRSETTHRSFLTNPCAKRQLVLMCGDGVNDAPALAASDVGVAMGAGAAVAMETADITLLDSDLSKLLYSLKMGRRVIQKITENIVFSFVTKLIVMILALFGKANLWTAIGTDIGSMLLVTLNGMTLLPKKDSNYEKMGDIENRTYKSQQASKRNQAEESNGVDMLNLKLHY